MKTIKKILTVLFIASILSVAAGVAFTIIYQEKVIALFVEEANKYLITPIKVGKIKFTITERFPDLTIVLNDVYIGESVKNSKEPLGVANKIFLSFSIINMLKGDYVIDQVIIKDADVRLRITKDGQLNYIITNRNSEKSSGKIKFDIDKITLENVAVTYHNQRKDELVDLVASNTKAKLSQLGSILSINIDGALFTNGITLENRTYFEEKEVEVDTDFTYDLSNSLINFYPSDLVVNKKSFLVDGTYQIGASDEIDLHVASENTDVATLISLLPSSIKSKIRKYESKGKIYLNGNIKGKLGRNQSPGVSIEFGCENAMFIYPENNKRMENVFLTGRFESPSVNNLGKASLSLENIKAVMDNRPINGGLILKNFNDLYIDCQIDATINTQSLLAFFPIEQLNEANGIVDMDISFDGNLKDFKNYNRINRVKSSGEIEITDLNFKLKTNSLQFRDFNGHFIFSNNDLAINDFKASAGNSHVVINGFFKNFLAQLLSKKQPMIIQANLTSSMIDLDELLSSEIATAPTQNNNPVKYYFDITPRLNLQFNCKVNRLKFRRFRGKNIVGDLWVKNQQAWTRNLSFNAAGGAVKLSGEVDARPKHDLIITTKANFDNINVDSTFYIFENFNQDFLEDRHLKGQFYSEVSSKLAFDKNLKWYPNSLIADVKTSIKNGELNNFEPMNRVAKYVRKEKLDHLRFSEISNHITIKNKVVTIPPMEVSSNVRTIKVQGTHTFDQRIYYDLVVPISNQDNKSDRDKRFGEVENNSQGNSNLFLTIIGTTDDYNVAINSTAVKHKIKADIKKEGKELKEIFQNKGKQEETIELNDEEYFDFDSVDQNKK